MSRPPLAQPLFFFSLLLVLGGAAGAVGSFFWSARRHPAAVVAPAVTGSAVSPSAAVPPAEPPLVEHSAWENRPGWKWAVEPMEWRSMRTVATAGGIISFAVGEYGVHVYLARGEQPSSVQPRTRYDAVALDSAGNRLEAVEMRASGAHDGVSLRHFQFSIQEAPADSIVRIGVEALTREGWRKVSARTRAQAEADGIRTLPFPEVGAPYPFDLGLPDGGSLRSADYAGRVVLFDCWASWCAPCMERMPELREVHGTYHDRGLDIVGVNFDLEWNRAEDAIEEHAPDWPHVFAGGSWEAIDLWGDATTVRGIPRFFLVDRDGILRWDSMSTDPQELNRAIEECLAG